MADVDPYPPFQEYAHPERLVSAPWLSARLGIKGLRVIEVDEDSLLYDIGHIPTATRINFRTELLSPLTRDFIDGKEFTALMRDKGINADDTIVLYGDKSNWWAAYAMWVFKLFGHADVRLMDGGRAKWEAEGREMTREKPQRERSDYPVVERNDAPIRALLPEVLEAIGQIPLIDVRSPQEDTGERTHMPDYPEEGALRGGHIPTAHSVPWATAANEDGTFKSADQLRKIYIDDLGLGKTDVAYAYCRIGERSSHTWFVLSYLLGFENVKNYDGSWTEWGNAMRVPIAQGDQPGEAPQK